MHTMQQTQHGQHSKNNSSDDIGNREDVDSNNIIRYNQHYAYQQQQAHKRRLHLFNHHE